VQLSIVRSTGNQAPEHGRRRAVPWGRRSRRARAAAVAFTISVAIVCAPAPAQARKLADVFRKELAGLELEPIGSALANTVASTYPVASASSSVTYAYNPALETFERRTGVLGPIIGERAETIGKGQVNLGVSYSYVHLTSINGQDLGSLENRPSIDGRVVSFPIVGPGGRQVTIQLANGRLTNFLPVHVKADLDVEAHIATPAITYGLTPDLDVNLTLPIVRTSLDVRERDEVPDPRLPDFQLPAGDPHGLMRSRSVSDSSVGVGDLLLRAKYVVTRGKWVDVAAGLGISLPSGDPDDFQGTGDTRVQPEIVFSRRFAGRIEPLLNLSADVNADDVDRSVLRWAIGATGQIAGPLSGALVFLGRHELDRQADKIAEPFFFQIERNDIYDVSIGFRCLLGQGGVASANVIVPLNDAGLRADAIPTFELEYAF
jgi:hypothetical protein